MTGILQTPPIAALSVTAQDMGICADARANETIAASFADFHLKQWKLTGIAAEGGLSRIYRAAPAGASINQTALYALKMPLPAWQDDAQAIRLLKREALVGRTVSHPHLIPILDASLEKPPRFVVMPWLEGTTLQCRMEAGERFDLPRILWIARQITEALDALHKAGWMHGDVKPGNIMLSPEGHATLLDLGFARRREETGSAVDRCVLGTFHYIAPEFLTSAVRADVRADIYSLGAVLYRMLSGRMPFECDDLAELATHHRQSIPPDLGRIAPHLPEGVVRLVHGMLAKDPLRRVQTPRELSDNIARLEIESFDERGPGLIQIR